MAQLAGASLAPTITTLRGLRSASTFAGAAVPTPSGRKSFTRPILPNRPAHSRATAHSSPLRRDTNAALHSPAT